MAYLEETRDGSVSLTIHVQPRASGNRIAGLFGDAVKIAITSPPVDNKANQAIIAFVAKLFRLPKSGVTIASGQQSRAKRLILAGISFEEAKRILDDHLR